MKIRYCRDCKHYSEKGEPCHSCLESLEDRISWEEETIDQVIQLIREERHCQDIKWGEQNHPPEKWVGILGEEFGEYCQAVNETVVNPGPKGGYDNMLKELTHVAAVAVGAMESLMRARDKT